VTPSITEVKTEINYREQPIGRKRFVSTSGSSSSEGELYLDFTEGEQDFEKVSEIYAIA